QLFFGSTSSTFTAGPSLVTGGPISAITSGKFDANNLADLLVLNPAASTFTEYLNPANGFTAQTPIAVTSTPTSIAAGVFSPSGMLFPPGTSAAFVGSATNNVLSILTTNSAGVFALSTNFTLPAGSVVTALGLGGSGTSFTELGVSNGP